MAKKRVQWDVPSNDDLEALEKENDAIAQSIIDRHVEQKIREQREAQEIADAVEAAKNFEKDAEW